MKIVFAYLLLMTVANPADDTNLDKDLHRSSEYTPCSLQRPWWPETYAVEAEAAHKRIAQRKEKQERASLQSALSQSQVPAFALPSDKTVEEQELWQLYQSVSSIHKQKLFFDLYSPINPN